MKLQHKTIWITGASSGIGEAMALELSKRNNKLILSGRNKKKLEQIKSEISNSLSECEIITFDLANKNEIERAVEEVLKKHTNIDLLVNNGGISQRSFAKETDIDVDRKIMEINYFGNIYLTKKVLPSMIQKGSGQIAVTSSIVGKFGFPLRTAYSASKHALYGFYESLRLEVKEHNIDVSIICPGRIRTNISYHALDKKGKEHGKMDEGQEKGMPAIKSAKKIIKGLENGKKEILVGGKELIMVYLKRFVPSLFFKIAGKINPS